jgi:N-formylglutamate amidohydrolase
MPAGRDGHVFCFDPSKFSRPPPDWVKGERVEPFEVVEPRSGESAVVVEVPHAGLWVDPETLAFTLAPARSIARDADLYVDQLFQDVPGEGATLITARYSRIVVDLNRSESDVDGEAVEGGGRTPWPRGLVWRLTTDGDPILAAPIPRQELERRLATVYRPYHRALQGLIQRKIQCFGYAVLLCAHSMPSQPRLQPIASPGQPARQHASSAHARSSGASQSSRSAWGATRVAPPVPRADVVPGTQGRTSAAGAVIDEVDAHARAAGFSVRHDDPYRGGFSTTFYGRPAQGVHAIQIEIARRLYMDETSLRIDAQGFRAVREFGRTLAARLAFAEPDAPTRKLRRELVCGPTEPATVDTRPSDTAAPPGAAATGAKCQGP